MFKLEFFIYFGDRQLFIIMKTLLLFLILASSTMSNVIAQSRDPQIIIMDKTCKKSHSFSCNNKLITLKIGDNCSINQYCIQEWKKDSFSVSYKKGDRLPKELRTEKDCAKLTKDSLYTIAYRDITSIRMEKRKGPIVATLISPFEKQYRFDNNWVLVAIAGNRVH